LKLRQLLLDVLNSARFWLAALLLQLLGVLYCSCCIADCHTTCTIPASALHANTATAANTDAAVLQACQHGKIAAAANAAAAVLQAHL
jgi:hypothetical protein